MGIAIPSCPMVTNARVAESFHRLVMGLLYYREPPASEITADVSRYDIIGSVYHRAFYCWAWCYWLMTSTVSFRALLSIVL